MNRLKKVAVAITIAAPLALTAAPAFAATEYPGGGQWNWGNTLGHNYSDYLHSGNTHSSTVICGDSTDRDIAAPGGWSNASLWNLSGCGFYWNNAA
ncbi:MAG: lactococcin 972 family bacteriocin [Microbacterium gubbeenense]|uniref:lactococcin 972 family bacteriocin n=1 Tax=Microbacterium gubbeenense TaxID=159896 RepID=UPI003F96E211